MKKNVGRYKGYRIVTGNKNLIGKKEGFIDKETGGLFIRKGNNFVNINSGEPYTYDITDKVFKFLEESKEKLELSCSNNFVAAYITAPDAFFETAFIDQVTKEGAVIELFELKQQQWKFNSDPQTFTGYGNYNLSKGSKDSKGILVPTESIDNNTCVTITKILSTSENSVDPKYWVAVDINIYNGK